MWQGVLSTRLPDLSLESARERSARMQELLERLDGVDPEALSHPEWVTLETLRWDMSIYAELADHYWLIFPITPYLMSELGVHTYFRSAQLETAEQAASYLEMARQYPAFVDAMHAKLEAQMERGIVLPAPELDLIVPTWKARVEAPETVFSAPGEAAPADSPKSSRPSTTRSGRRGSGSSTSSRATTAPRHPRLSDSASISGGRPSTIS